MMWRYNYTDELYHYGVKGMRWGHRKAQYRLAQTGHRALAGVYGINERFWRRAGNNTLASMNKAAKNQQLKKVSKVEQALGPKKTKSTKTNKPDMFTKAAGKAVGKSYKVNEAIERKKASAASKLGMNRKAQTYKNNADYYKKVSSDLMSGKVAKPKTKYQKAMRYLGKTDFATRSIKNSKYLNPQQKAQALTEQRMMRVADGWYKKKAARDVMSLGLDAIIANNKRKHN